jgi:hypothetical protein
MRHVAAITVTIAGLLMAAYSVKDEFVDRPSGDVAEAFDLLIDAIIARDHDAVVGKIQISYTDEEFAEAFGRLYEHFSGSTYISHRISNYFSYRDRTGPSVNRRVHHAIYDFEYTDGWARIELAFLIENEKIEMRRFTMLPLSLRLEEHRAFSLVGKPAKNYVILILAILSPIFIVSTLAACVQMNHLKHKSLWLAFILFGVGGITLNWTHGFVHFKALSVGLLGVGFYKANAISAAKLFLWLPLGASLFWILRLSRNLPLIQGPSSENRDSYMG